MKITILYKGRKLLNVSMQNDMSVRRLRDIIEETHHIPTEKQTLTYNGHILENGRLLEQHYGIHDKSEVTLSLPLNFEPNFRIYVKVPGGLMIKRHVNRNDLVSELKWSIEDVTKIPVTLQALSYGSWLMEDNVRLGDYNIRRGSVVHVLRRPNPVPISDVGSQVPQYRIPGRDEGDSKADSGVADLLIVRPSPIKRLSVNKIPESVASLSEAIPLEEEEGKVEERAEGKEVEKIEPIPKPITPTPVPKLGNNESLRLNLPETEAYRNFRQALSNRMVAQNGENGVENNA
ncbi:Polyubiquitin [Taenia solium]|eukprot:TsM_000121800 transcript=TsM_000121800 gene=TsM_000121800